MLFDLFAGFLYLLSGIWGFIALPFAIIFLWLPEMREVGKRLGVLVLLFFLVLAHDIVAHVNGHRAWVPFYERVLPFWIPMSDSDKTLACVNLNSRKLEMTLRHLRNRNYGFCVWIPRQLDDFTKVGPRIRLKVTFFDASGRRVFATSGDDSFPYIWYVCRADRGGSTLNLLKYNVPNDVPYDETLKAVIELSGDVEEFMRLYPDAVLRAESMCARR